MARCGSRVTEARAWQVLRSLEVYHPGAVDHCISTSDDAKAALDKVKRLVRDTIDEFDFKDVQGVYKCALKLFTETKL